MRYAVTFCEPEYERVREHLNAGPHERAAYLLCRMAVSEADTTLLVREVIPVSPDEVVSASPDHMSIGSRSFTRAMKRASDSKQCLVFVHSHPGGYPDFSPQDDEEEAKLFRSAYIRIQPPAMHASMVFGPSGVLAGRVWLEDGSRAPIERVRVIGRQFQYQLLASSADRVPEFFDRQVRAFGPDIQRLLAQLRIGVVGAGGTGSAVIEQLIRLGVGAIVVADKDTFQPSNVNRVYRSRLTDDGVAKVEIVRRSAAEIGLGTTIEPIARSITYESVLRRFQACDVIFGCTDDQWGRSLLTRFAVYYFVPVFDVAVKVDSEEGVIRSIQGRVTTMLPGAACMYCRGRITADRVLAESKWETNPAEAEALAREGYIAGLDDPAPAVIPFTTAVAASAVTEFLHRLTGFLGSDRDSTEVLHLVDDTRIRTNSKQPLAGCFCGDDDCRGRGDTVPMLDITWRRE